MGLGPCRVRITCNYLVAYYPATANCARACLIATQRSVRSSDAREFAIFGYQTHRRGDSICGNCKLIRLFLGHSYRLGVTYVAQGLAPSKLAVLSLGREQANEISIFCCAIDRLVAVCFRHCRPPGADCRPDQYASSRSWRWDAVRRSIHSYVEQ